MKIIFYFFILILAFHLQISYKITKTLTLQGNQESEDELFDMYIYQQSGSSSTFSKFKRRIVEVETESSNIYSEVNPETMEYNKANYLTTLKYENIELPCGGMKFICTLENFLKTYPDYKREDIPKYLTSENFGYNIETNCALIMEDVPYSLKETMFFCNKDRDKVEKFIISISGNVNQQQLNIPLEQAGYLLMDTQIIKGTLNQTENAISFKNEKGDELFSKPLTEISEFKKLEKDFFTPDLTDILDNHKEYNFDSAMIISFTSGTEKAKYYFFTGDKEANLESLSKTLDTRKNEKIKEDVKKQIEEGKPADINYDALGKDLVNKLDGIKKLYQENKGMSEGEINAKLEEEKAKAIKEIVGDNKELSDKLTEVGNKLMSQGTSVGQNADNPYSSHVDENLENEKINFLSAWNYLKTLNLPKPVTSTAEVKAKEEDLNIKRKIDLLNYGSDVDLSLEYLTTFSDAQIE